MTGPMMPSPRTVARLEDAAYLLEVGCSPVEAVTRVGWSLEAAARAGFRHGYISEARVFEAAARRTRRKQACRPYSAV